MYNSSHNKKGTIKIALANVKGLSRLCLRLTGLFAFLHDKVTRTHFCGPSHTRTSAKGPISLYLFPVFQTLLLTSPYNLLRISPRSLDLKALLVFCRMSIVSATPSDSDFRRGQLNKWQTSSSLSCTARAPVRCFRSASAPTMF